MGGELALPMACGDGTGRARVCVGIAKQFFRAAIRERIVLENPFDGQSTAVRENRKRQHFVSRVEAQVVPIFPELYSHLQNAFDEAEPGTAYCCPQYPNPNQMYRKAMLKVIEQAGLKPWPKLFQNLRASRETELAEKYPIQVVCSWIGNSPQVAAKHYLQVTEDHFVQAAKKTVQDPVQKTAALPRTDLHAESGEAREPAIYQAICKNTPLWEDKEAQLLGDTGLEPVTSRV